MILDISQPLKNGVPVWPGDTEFTFDLTLTLAESGSVNVGRLTMSTHTGTHADAPFHFRDDGTRVGMLDPEAFIGPARVIEAREESIGAEELGWHDLDGIERLLVKTGSWLDRTVFPGRISYFRPDAGQFLAEKGIRLVGVDTPSVDPLDSKDLPAHEALRSGGIHILEGLVLDKVEPGDYELIALPLALEEADASPVRAVLRTTP
ncbi:arylformamidase [soil metagenome]|nr:arylformamidase [Rubrobacter sp.]